MNFFFPSILLIEKHIRAGLFSWRVLFHPVALFGATARTEHKPMGITYSDFKSVNRLFIAILWLLRFHSICNFRS